jgi:hypothetical protein
MRNDLSIGSAQLAREATFTEAFSTRFRTGEVWNGIEARRKSTPLGGSSPASSSSAIVSTRMLPWNGCPSGTLQNSTSWMRQNALYFTVAPSTSTPRTPIRSVP